MPDETPSGSGQTVAVTGATGKTGRAIVGSLLAAGFRVRALTRDPASAPAAVRAADLVTGDLEREADLVRLLAGCQAVYHVPPNMSARESQFADALIRAARTAAVTRIVYHSVLHPQVEAMPHHWAKLRVEERLLTSGLETVVVQPAPYLQNLTPYVTAVLAGRPTPFPYGPDVRLSAVDLRDVAEVAARVVVGAAHVGASYQLCGPDQYTSGAVWERATRHLGITAPYPHVDVDTWRATAGADLPPRVADWLARMFTYYERHGLLGASTTLAALLGRRPRDLDDYLADDPDVAAAAAR